MRLHTIVLDISQDREPLLFGIEDALSEVNRSSAVAFASTGMKQTDNAEYRTWADYSGSKDTWIRLADDRKVPALYIDISVADVALRETICATLAKYVRILSCGELKTMAGATSTPKPGLLAWLGFACRGTYDLQVATAIQEGFASPDPSVRANAQLATLVLQWKQLVPVIEVATVSEGDAALKRSGEHILEILRAM